jgi:hypothetical protein
MTWGVIGAIGAAAVIVGILIFAVYWKASGGYNRH